MKQKIPSIAPFIGFLVLAIGIWLSYNVLTGQNPFEWTPIEGDIEESIPTGNYDFPEWELDKSDIKKGMEAHSIIADVLKPYPKLAIEIDKRKYTVLLDEGHFVDLRRGHDEDPGIIIRSTALEFKKMKQAAEDEDQEKLVNLISKAEIPVSLKVRMAKFGLVEFSE